MEAAFFDPMLPCKTFATNSLKYMFMQDVWFGRDCVCSKIEHLSNRAVIASVARLNICQIVMRLRKNEV